MQRAETARPGDGLRIQEKQILVKAVWVMFVSSLPIILPKLDSMGRKIACRVVESS
jgi:hypothetical protein